MRQFWPLFADFDCISCTLFQYTHDHILLRWVHIMISFISVRENDYTFHFVPAVGQLQYISVVSLLASRVTLAPRKLVPD